MNFTTRLRIERLRESHAQAMLPAQLDERIYRYIPATRQATVEGLAERYRRLSAGSPDPGVRWLNWCLFLRGSGLAIGHLQSTISVDDRSAWMAYVLSPDFWGRGHATEAVAWLLEHLASSAAVDVVRARIDHRNVASLAVVERLRFERQADVLEDGIVDHVYERRL